MRPDLARLALPLFLLGGLALAAPAQATPNRMAQGFTRSQQIQQRLRIQQRTFPAQLGPQRKATDALTRQLQSSRRQMQGAYYQQQQLLRHALPAPVEPQIKLKAPAAQPALPAAAAHRPGLLHRMLDRLLGR